MEELLADNEDGRQRIREAVERKERWLAGQGENEDKETVLTETAVSADTEEGNASMATDEVENRDHAETFVRVAILGKRSTLGLGWLRRQPSLISPRERPLTSRAAGTSARVHIGRALGCLLRSTTRIVSSACRHAPCSACCGSLHHL